MNVEDFINRTWPGDLKLFECAEALKNDERFRPTFDDRTIEFYWRHDETKLSVKLSMKVNLEVWRNPPDGFGAYMVVRGLK